MISPENHIYRLAVRYVFLFQDACCECVVVVVRKYRDDLLHNDGSVVEELVDEVHGAAGYLYSVIESLFLRVESGKCRKQRWVHIDDALREGMDEFWRKQSHVSGETDEIDLGCL